MRSSLYSKFLSFLRSFILLHLLTCSMLISSHQRTSLQGLPVAMLASQQAVRKQTTTCRRCKQQFVKEDNHAQACQFHTAIFTGGEISKASPRAYWQSDLIQSSSVGSTRLTG